MIAADLRRRGYKIAIPYGEDWDFDLIVCREGRLERVQCKYTRSNGIVMTIRPRSSSLTNGKVRAVKRYTAATIDWLGVYDATSERCFYVPAADLGDGMNVMHIRLAPTRNNQRRRIRVASDFTEI